MVAKGVVTEGEKVVREVLEQEELVVADVEVADEVKQHIIKMKSTSDMTKEATKVKILLRTPKGGMNGIHLVPLIAMPKTGNAKATAKLIRIGYVVNSDYAMPIEVARPAFTALPSAAHRAL